MFYKILKTSMPNEVLDSWFNGAELGDIKTVIENIKNVEIAAKTNK